jgi:hypothetical protein
MMAVSLRRYLIEGIVAASLIFSLGLPRENP